MKKIIGIGLILAVVVISSFVYFYKTQGQKLTNEENIIAEQSINDQVISGIARNSGVCSSPSETCTVDLVKGDFAKGKMPQAYWIASRSSSGWKVVLSGNGMPQCSEVDQFSIPREIYGNCIEGSGNLRHD